MTQRLGYLDHSGRSEQFHMDVSPCDPRLDHTGLDERPAGVLDDLFAATEPSGPSALSGSAAPASLMVVDEQGDIVLASRALEELFGYPAEGLPGTPLGLVLPWSWRPFPERGGTPEPGAPPLWGRRRDGSHFPVTLEVSPLAIGDDRYALVTAHETIPPDLTEPSLTADAATKMAIVADRQRIARQLHDRVVPHLFAAGLAVSAVSDRIADSVARARVTEVVRDLDAAIGDVRSVVFELAPAERSPSLRDRVVELCAQECDLRQVTSSVQFRGLVDALAAPQAEALLAVLRETLASVVRHGGASTSPSTWRSMSTPTSRSGSTGTGRCSPEGSFEPPEQELEELAVRARALGGVFRVRTANGTASRIDWRVPRR